MPPYPPRAHLPTQIPVVLHGFVSRHHSSDHHAPGPMPPNATVGYQTIYTDKDKFLRNDEASKIHNEGKRLQRAHNYAAAEQCYLRAIAIRDELWGMGSTQAAVNQVALGEMYVEMGKLDEAEWMFQHVLEVYDQHQALRDHFDAAAVRESLAQVYEAKGDGREARRVRARGLPDHLACGNYKCPGAMFTIKAVQRCSHCKCIMYCTPVCQNIDWKRHKKYCMEVARSLGIES